MSLCLSYLPSMKWKSVDRKCINSFGHLTTFLGLLVTLASDWVNILFFELSRFHGDFPVLYSKDVIWIIKKLRLVITSGYFKMSCQTLLTLITVPWGCFHLRLFYRYACWTLSEVTCLVLWNVFSRRIKIPSSYVETVQ